MANEQVERNMKRTTPNQAWDQSESSADLGLRQRFANRLLWICGAIGVLAAVTSLLLFGISIWMAIVFVVLLACPAIIAWVLAVSRKQPPPAPGRET